MKPQRRFFGIVALLAACVVAGCAATGAGTPATNLDPRTLNEGGRKLASWKEFTDLDTTLTQKCLLDAEASVRAAQFDACYATPMAQTAAKVGFPLKAELNAYLNGSRSLAQKAAAGTMPASEYRTEQAKLLDVFVVAVNRHLAKTTDYFAGGRIIFLGDPLMTELKKAEAARFVDASEISSFLGVTQTALTNSVRAKIAARGADPAILGDKLDLSSADKRFLSQIYAAHIMAFYTYDDLRRLNAFYTEGGVVRARKHQASLYGSAEAAQTVSTKKVMRAVSRGLMELGTMNGEVK